MIRMLFVALAIFSARVMADPCDTVLRAQAVAAAVESLNQNFAYSEDTGFPVQETASVQEAWSWDSTSGPVDTFRVSVPLGLTDAAGAVSYTNAVNAFVYRDPQSGTLFYDPNSVVPPTQMPSALVRSGAFRSLLYDFNALGISDRAKWDDEIALIQVREIIDVSGSLLATYFVFQMRLIYTEGLPRMAGDLDNLRVIIRKDGAGNLLQVTPTNDALFDQSRVRYTTVEN